jgi:hypothetical protein
MPAMPPPWLHRRTECQLLFAQFSKFSFRSLLPQNAPVPESVTLNMAVICSSETSETPVLQARKPYKPIATKVTLLVCQIPNTLYVEECDKILTAFELERCTILLNRGEKWGKGGAAG